MKQPGWKIIISFYKEQEKACDFYILNGLQGAITNDYS